MGRFPVPMRATNRSLGTAVVWATALEACLVAVFLAFPVGSCDQPLPGVVVVFLHFPALLVLGMFGSGNAVQMLGSPLLMLLF
jgi:hypothetical protein